MKLLQGIAGGALGMAGGLLVMFIALGNFAETGASASPHDNFEAIVSVPIPATAQAS